MAESSTAKKGDTDTSSNAKGRFVVSLPSDVGAQIDQVGEKLAAAVRQETGIAFELSRAQIVQALVRQALTDNNGDGDGDDTEKS